MVTSTTSTTPTVEVGANGINGLADPGKKSHHSHSCSESGGKDNLVNDTSIVHYDDEYERLNSDYSVAWNKAMRKGTYRDSPQYKNVFALMISWESKHDDLHVKQEVDTLSAVLRDTFGYEVIPALLECNGKRAQAQVNHLVAQFMYQHDGPNNLLIVYFAGHGTPGSVFGHLELAGKSGFADSRDNLDRIVWNRTEICLQGAEADILEIFDCCYAGDLGPPRGCPHAFEYLAATSSGETTRKPGKHSFTTALIWALRTLCEERGQFTTTDLLNTIKKRAPDFPKDQSPVLSDRNRGSPRERIFLQPLQKNGTDSRRHEPRPNQPSPAKPQEILSLNLFFDARPSIDQIEGLGIGLNKVVEDNDLQISRIVWGGLDSRPHMALVVAKRWRKAVQQRVAKATSPVSGGPSIEAIVRREMQHQKEEGNASSYSVQYLTKMLFWSLLAIVASIGTSAQARARKWSPMGRL